MQLGYSAFNTHEAFQAVNFTAEQAKVLINLLNEQVAIQSLLLSRDDFVSAIEKKSDKDDIKLLIEQMDKRFEVVDKRFETLTKRLDRFMLWSFSTTIATGGLVIAILKWT